MSDFKCKNCGASLNAVSAVNGVIECDYCHSKFTIPKNETSPAALNFLRIGEHELDICEFEKAYESFRKAAQYDQNEPEAYWGMALAEFKVQYIKDIKNNRLQPICHEISSKAFGNSQNYLMAVRLACANQRVEYIRKAQEIDSIRKEFFNLKKSGLDYDCFICVKVTGDNGLPTEDSKDADYIYRLLQRNGYAPFYSEYEIRNRVGVDYEALILYALYTSETMLVVCRNEEYLHTPWVKNEYTRFLKLVHDEDKESDSITFVYNKTPIDKLPGKNGRIQGIDFNQRDADNNILGFVEIHTPRARAKREEEKRRKESENTELRRQLEEQRKRQEELEKRLANSAGGGLSDEDLLVRIERARQEKERKAKEEAERLQREEAERQRRAKEEAERLQREEAERIRREVEERKQIASNQWFAKNYMAAFPVLLELAESGDAECQFKVGYCYHNGEGVAQDDLKAVHWFKKSAAQGYTSAQSCLGLAYEHGEGVEKDYEKAFYWCQQAAVKGNLYAQYNLGLYYANGRGVAKDKQKAIFWLKRSAAQGFKKAEDALRKVKWGIKV